MTARPGAPRWPLADGHADSLLWNRDLTVRHRRGHVDFPRLREAERAGASPRAAEGPPEHEHRTRLAL